MKRWGRVDDWPYQLLIGSSGRVQNRVNTSVLEPNRREIESCAVEASNEVIDSW